VTITDIGILLIVLCILLWAIMAALHRHTVQLQALKAQMEALQKAQHHEPGHAEEGPAATTRRDNVEELTVHAPGKKPVHPTFRE
jgi:hypothetical protein